MSERQSRKAMIKMAAAAVVVISLTGFSYWFFNCPCDRTPGGYLLGAEAEAPVTDWTFANDVTLCQIQIGAGLLPHSINLNCMATSTGDLYLSCSQCASKRWSNAALGNSTARLRLNDTVYPVDVTRVMDPAELDRAWSARSTKLNTLTETATAAPPPGTPRPTVGGPSTWCLDSRTARTERSARSRQSAVDDGHNRRRGKRVAEHTGRHIVRPTSRTASTGACRAGTGSTRTRRTGGMMREALKHSEIGCLQAATRPFRCSTSQACAGSSSRRWSDRSQRLSLPAVVSFTHAELPVQCVRCDLRDPSGGDRQVRRLATEVLPRAFPEETSERPAEDAKPCAGRS